MGKERKARYCFSCGCFLARYVAYDPMDHCRKPECQALAQAYMADAQQRSLAERGKGWGASTNGPVTEPSEPTVSTEQ